MYQIRMEYNPYKQEISYQFLGSKGWQKLSPENKLENNKYKETALQTSVDEILKQIIMVYATDAEHSVGIVFCGTDEDYADLTDAIQRNPKVMNGAAKVVAEKDKESFYQAASVVAEKIDSIFSGLENEFSQLQDEDVKDILRQYDDASSSTIPLCVMGLYSSGKSMFINALIGEEILPSGSDPLTAQIFKVTPGTNYQVAFSCENMELHFEIIEQTVRLTNSEDCSQCSAWIKEMTGISGTTNADIMRQIISKLNDSDKLSDKLKCEGLTPVSGLISIEVPFRNSALPAGKIHFEIYDTPGSDSKSHDTHIKALQTALKERTNGLPILITKRNDLDRNSIQSLMDELNNAEIKLDRENLMILINQADQEECNDLGKFHANPPEGVVTIQKKSSIIFLSSAVAVGCKKDGNSGQWCDNRCRKAYKDNKNHFSVPSDEDYMSLPRYSVLPPSRYEDICQRAQKAEDTVTSGDTSEEAIRELIAQNSGIRAVESEITYYAQRFADYNKCQMASGYLKEAIEITKRQEKNRQTDLELKKGERESQYSNTYKTLQERLHSFTEGFYNEARKHDTIPQQISENITNVIFSRFKSNAKSSFTKHQKDKDTAGFQREIDIHFKKSILSYSELIRPIIVDFWEKKAEEYKIQLVEVINGDSQIPDQEKELLSEYVMGTPKYSPTPVNFDVGARIAKTKGILWWRGLKFNESECWAKFNTEFGRKSLEILSQTRNLYSNEFNSWSGKLTSAIGKRLGEFNPQLQKLSEEINECEENLCQVEAELEKLSRAWEEIGQLTLKQENKEEQL